MKQYVDDIKRLGIKVLPFIISLIFTFVIFISLFSYHPVVGTVTTEVISVWT